MSPSHDRPLYLLFREPVPRVWSHVGVMNIDEMRKSTFGVFMVLVSGLGFALSNLQPVG